MPDLRITPEASLDLEDIMISSLHHFGETVAERYFEQIERTMLRLCDFPNSGVVYPGTRPPVRYATSGSHRIFYTPENGGVTVWRVLHEKMRPDGRLRPR